MLALASGAIMGKDSTSVGLAKTNYVTFISSVIGVLFLGASAFPSKAVEKDVNGTISFNTSAPTNADVPNWSIGWGASAITGWDLVGTVGGAAGVYVGNGWVLTAAHVDPGTFTLGGTTYDVTPGSTQTLQNSDGSLADLKLFHLTLQPDLPALAISTTAPSAFSANQAGTEAVIIGFGGGQGETWGLNTVTQTDISVQQLNYTSIDFETAYGTTTVGHGANTKSVTNDYILVLGDSGGGDFMWNASTAQWNLAGINEAVDSNNNSYMVQLADYAPQINSIIGVPEPSSLTMLCFGLSVLFFRPPRHLVNS